MACWACCKIARCEVNLRKRPCLKRSAISSHTIWSLNNGKTVFCARCGCRSTQRVKLLRKVCRRAPANPSMARLLSDLRKGYVPRVGYAGPPIPAADRVVPGTATVAASCRVISSHEHDIVATLQAPGIQALS